MGLCYFCWFFPRPRKIDKNPLLNFIWQTSMEQWVFLFIFLRQGLNLVNVNRNSYGIFMLVEKFQFMFWMLIDFFRSLFHFCFCLQNYFSCFFSLPIVISSMRWGVDAGRKTLVRLASSIIL